MHAHGSEARTRVCVTYTIFLDHNIFLLYLFDLRNVRNQLINKFLSLSLSFRVASALRVKRQDSTTQKNEESFEKELCKDKDAGEWFRLVAGDGDACRDVIQCTSSVSGTCLFSLFIIYR